jgi:hypothetical protein
MNHPLLSLFSVSFLLCLSGCFSNLKTDGSIKNKSVVSENTHLYHLVFCWLKEEGNESHRQKIIEATQTFRTIPGVIQAEAGKVVEGERDIVDDSFDVGILIVTQDRASLKKYLDHPIHQKAKKEVLSPLVKRVLVYDFEK